MNAISACVIADRPIDRPIFRPIFGPMDILTVSQAKPHIGRLIERALRGEAVVIRKGARLVQLTEYVVPEPIPDRPVGYFRRNISILRRRRDARRNKNRERKYKRTEKNQSVGSIPRAFHNDML